jgi:hypothetical protein
MTPSLKRKRRTPPRSPSSWSPQTKSAARTIKRIVTKKYAQEKYRNYTVNEFAHIRRGFRSMHTSAIKRRMYAFPVKVNVPLYRGVPRTLIAKLLNSGQLVNTSFSSFSKSRNVAERFANNPRVLVLPPGRYPAINRKRFLNNSYEYEVTLAPGVYTMNGFTNKGNIRVTYKPLNGKTPSPRRSVRGH